LANKAEAEMTGTISKELAQSKAGRATAPDNVKCRICQNERGSRFTSNGFAWLRCDRCGVVQKVLTLQQYQALNPSYDPGAFLDAATPDQLEQFLGLADATKVIDTAMQRYMVSAAKSGGKRSFLDVGCGMGTYLLAAKRRGFDVLGFEPSTDHAYVATKHLKLPVIADYFTRERVGAQTFDLIMLSHVIEHIYSPKEFLQDLISILKPGGALIVITPNSDSLVARITGGGWPMLKPIDHVTLIAAKTYAFLGLDESVEIHHWFTEYPFEFAATLAAVVIGKLKPGAVNAPKSPGQEGSSSPPPLRKFTARAQLLKGVLTIASAPAWLLAGMTGKRACLNTAIVRRVEG
jgi:SAM-dependent methyltransferase